jgi:endonuclease/exonuclease/phosphatase family metal-dependent hydrolase
MRAVLKIFSLALCLAAVCCSNKPEAQPLRIVSYNVGAFSKYITEGTGSTSMIASMLLEAGAGAVGVNECDSVNTRHPVNQVADLAAEMGGWQWWFGRAMAYKGGAYGNGALVPADAKVRARYTVQLAKSSGSEPRSIAVIETDEFVLGAAHLDYRTEEAQMEQVEQVNAWAAAKYENCGKPVFFLGDMNAYPESAPIAALKKSWDLLSVTDQGTYPSREPKKCIDYIFHFKRSAEVRLIGAGVMTEFKTGDVTMASDHLPIYVDVLLP